MGSDYKDLFFTLPALVEIAAIVPREHFRGAFDFYALGFEVFVDVHIGLDIDRVSQQFRDKGPLQGFSIDINGVFDKVPGYIAVGAARLRIHLVHQLGKIHFRIFHQLLCLDPVHDDGLSIKTVWRPAPHIVAFGTPGIKSVLHAHLDAFPFQLGKHDTDIEHRPAHWGRGIKFFRTGHKLHIVLLEQLHELCKVHNGAADPIQLVDDHPLDEPQLDVLQKPLEVRAFNILAGVTFILVLPALTAFQFVTAKFKLTFNADTVLFVNRLPPINRVNSVIHN